MELFNKIFGTFGKKGLDFDPSEVVKPPEPEKVVEVPPEPEILVLDTPKKWNLDLEKIKSLFFGNVSPHQASVLNKMVSESMKAGLDKQGIAYLLATARHEVGSPLEPVREGFSKTDAEAIAKVTQLFNEGKIKANYAKPDPFTGRSYFGRGYVQLTHKYNYEKLAPYVGVDLVKFPEKALEPDIAMVILVQGMKHGLFTGVSLDDVSEPITSDPDFRNDRRVINGTDRAEKIAEYANIFYGALV